MSTRMTTPAPWSTSVQACSTCRITSSNESSIATLTESAASSGPTIVPAAWSKHRPAPPWVTTTTPITGSLSSDAAMVEASIVVQSRSSGARALDIAVPDRDRDVLAQALPQLLGDHPRPVPPAGAADGHGGVGLALAPEALDRQAQQLFRLV